MERKETVFLLILNKTITAMDLSAVPVKSRPVVTRKTGSEYVLVPVINNIANMDSVYTLNETGAFIWDEIDGKKTITDIIHKLSEEYDVDENMAKDDVLDFIEKMRFFLVIE